MSVLTKQIAVCLIVLTLPLQGVAAAMTALQGPAHYHLDGAKTRLSPAERPQASRQPHHPHHSHHGQGEVRRHYHLPGERALLVQDHRHDDSAPVEERTPRGESPSAAFVALIPESPGFPMPNLAGGIEIGPAKELLSCIPRRIERPPRLLPA